MSPPPLFLEYVNKRVVDLKLEGNIREVTLDLVGFSYRLGEEYYDTIKIIENIKAEIKYPKISPNISDIILRFGYKQDVS